MAIKDSNMQELVTQPIKVAQKSFKRWIFLGILVLLVGIMFLTGFSFNRFELDNPLGMLNNFIFTPKDSIILDEGRINLLILGKSGAGNDSPDLTDSIIFASVGFDNPGVVTVSLPRDIWIPSLRAKLNSAYYWGNKNPDLTGASTQGGLLLAKNQVEEIVGAKISYVFVIDFSGFEKLIDVVGGVNVNVGASFVDNDYPIAGKENDLCDGDKLFRCRYETISFNKGIQKMDGVTALKYVRSRRAVGDEGTDLARARRQEEVLVALKEKLFSLSTILSPVRLWKVATVVKDSMETNISSTSLATLGRKIIDGRGKVQTNVLKEEFIMNPKPNEKQDFQYVFLPISGNWQQVWNWVNSLLK